MAHESSALPRSRENPYGYCFSAALCPIRGRQCFSIWWKSWLKEGIFVEVGVFGEGTLGASTRRLSAMGAENCTLRGAIAAVDYPRHPAPNRIGSQLLSGTQL
jgi:hypothetical protein